MEKRLILFLLISGIMLACNEDISPDIKPFYIDLDVPEYMGTTVPFPERNPFSKEGIELGRMLFYDPILSSNNQVSCATCHKQELAFSDGMSLSTLGVSGEKLQRHTPALINLAWNNGLFWDGGAKDLESLAFAPLTHPDEMNQDITELVEELKQIPDYKERFKKVFGKDTIQSALIVRALAQFQRSLVSFDSKYDRYLKSGEAGFLNALELEGMQLVEEKCGGCHSGVNFTDLGFHNNGLDAEFPAAPEHVGKGRNRVTLNPEELGAFKTPTLRNIILTAPYMHDGRFKSIDEVLDHYAQNMVNSPTLDTLLTGQNDKIGIPISENEKQAIVAFLHTLTDLSFIQNQAFSNPFKK
ncbi:cytochrome-c peroxidase [Flexithrix dorotheae]|uniref:cytochrome-c peroxidase n=1 Tax=Flexithrix dorotheae TaxID=70993 RepID=UPI0012F84226|nr:cytochrome c peroxidase [Flexithrix dorotheae]